MYPKFASSLYGRALAEQTTAAEDFPAAKTIDPKIAVDFGS
jgi:hypothetical protein